MPPKQGQDDEHGRPDQHRTLLDPLHPCPLGYLRRQEIELFHCLVGFGQRQADRRRQDGPDLAGLLLTELQLGGIEPSQRGNSQYRQADLVLEQGAEPVQFRAATGDQHP